MTQSQPTPTAPVLSSNLIEEFSARLVEAVKSHAISNAAQGGTNGSPVTAPNLAIATRNASIFLHLYGLGSKGPDSLRKVAAEHEISAERVRQVCDDISANVIPLIVTGPEHADLRRKLAQAIDRIRELSPGGDMNITETLRRTNPEILGAGKGSSEDLKASAVIRLAEILGHRTGLGMHDWEGVTGLADVGMPNCVQSLLTHARKIAAASGAVSATRLAAEFEEARGIPLTPREIESILTPFFSRLSSSSADNEAWLWSPQGSNDTVARARNRIAAFGWCTLENLTPVQEMSSALAAEAGQPVRTRGRKPGAEWRMVPAKRPRTRSRYFFPLPNDVLVELLKANGFKVTGGEAGLEVRLAEGGETSVVAAPRKGKAGVSARLSSGKGAMVDIFKAMAVETPDGRVSQKEFVETCVAQGMSQATVRLYLYRSSLFACQGGFCVLTP